MSNNNMDKQKRLQDKIDEAKKRIECIEIEIKKIHIEESEIEKQIQWCRVMGCEKEARNILDHQDKKRCMLESYIVSKNNEEFKIKDV